MHASLTEASWRDQEVQDDCWRDHGGWGSIEGEGVCVHLCMHTYMHTATHTSIYTYTYLDMYTYTDNTFPVTDLHAAQPQIGQDAAAASTLLGYQIWRVLTSLNESSQTFRHSSLGECFIFKET